MTLLIVLNESDLALGVQDGRVHPNHIPQRILRTQLPVYSHTTLNAPHLVRTQLPQKALESKQRCVLGYEVQGDIWLNHCRQRKNLYLVIQIYHYL